MFHLDYIISIIIMIMIMMIISIIITIIIIFLYPTLRYYTILYSTPLHMNVVPRSTMNTNGETEN